ncbi:MAG: TIGR03364 family FAD-dependent oxidoreductase [Planctomycetes bacterium]|nr:TIGR03364 family FAD-dependent oxidoreductase [Planctomycetota bacterium]
MSRGRVVVIGSGILGLAHALRARDEGFEVTLLERDERPLGASVRNFGTLWPIGCTFGVERDQALFGVQRWRELARAADFWIAESGSLSLAYREEAWSVLGEFAEARALGGAKLLHDFELLDPHAVARRWPAVETAGLRGALWSRAEAQVQPAQALAALLRYAIARGVDVTCGALVSRVEDRHVETSDGRRFDFDQLLIAAGADMRLLFPREIAAAGVQRCRLQMLRTVPQPPEFQLGAILVSDLTLCHYPAFRACPSVEALRERLMRELPRHLADGIHVIAAQHPDGTLTLGDSHEYGADFSPELASDVEERILEVLRSFVRIRELRIAARWEGIYLKSTRGETQVVIRPRRNVTLVTAMGGLGMTLGFGLAERTVAGWVRA